MGAISREAACRYRLCWSRSCRSVSRFLRRVDHETASGLPALTFHLAIVSSISFGGFPTVLPDVRAFVVSTHGWLTYQDFTNIFAMAQAIPGPNMILMMGLIGWKVWGLAGALAAATATFAPPCAIYFAAFRRCTVFRKRAGNACSNPRSFL